MGNGKKRTSSCSSVSIKENHFEYPATRRAFSLALGVLGERLEGGSRMGCSDGL